MRLSPDDLREARAWLADCAWADAEPEDIYAMPEGAVARAVARHHEGGIPGFLAAAQPA
jgi:hypothetical protein